MTALSRASALRWRSSLLLSSHSIHSSVLAASQQQLRQSHQRSLPSTSRDLLAFDRQFDVHPDKHLVSSSSNSTHLINDPPIYKPPRDHPKAFAPPSSALQETTTVLSGNEAAAQATGLSLPEILKLHRYALVLKRVSQMTPKGKIPTMFAMVVVGNGDGIVGLGQGKHTLAARALDKAFVHAVKDMTAVDRFQDRTIWGSRKDHWGATDIEMWSRPPGQFLVFFTPDYAMLTTATFDRFRSSNQPHHSSDRQSRRSLRSISKNQR